MVIQKEEKEYTVKRTQRGWTVTRVKGAIKINYKVPASLAPDEEALIKYVQESELF